MMRYLLIGCIFVITLAGLRASDVEPLMNVTGVEFNKALEALAKDESAVQRLRASPVVGSAGNQLRQELMGRLVLARVDSPRIFASFADMLSLIRSDSPLVPDAQWWESVSASGRMMPDTAMLSQFHAHWVTEVTLPANTEAWVKVYREEIPVVSSTDLKWSDNRIWPALAYGLTAEPTRLRQEMKSSFRRWASQEENGELQLEALLWLCERTDFEWETSLTYAVSLSEGFKHSKDKARLVTRILAKMEVPGNFFKNGAYGDSDLNRTEKFGNSSHAPVLRRLAAMPFWSDSRDLMLDIAQRLEANSTDKSHVVTRQLAEMERAKKFDDMMIGYRVPDIIDDSVKYGTPAHASVLRKLAELPIWAKYRERMLEVANQLENKKGESSKSP